MRIEATGVTFPHRYSTYKRPPCFSTLTYNTKRPTCLSFNKWCHVCVHQRKTLEEKFLYFFFLKKNSDTRIFSCKSLHHEFACTFSLDQTVFCLMYIGIFIIDNVISRNLWSIICQNKVIYLSIIHLYSCHILLPSISSQLRHQYSSTFLT